MQIIIRWTCLLAIQFCRCLRVFSELISYHKDVNTLFLSNEYFFKTLLKISKIKVLKFNKVLKVTIRFCSILFLGQ